MNWAELQALGDDDDVPAETVRELAHRHGLDLPHQPVAYPLDGGRWALHCQGCTLDYGSVQTQCRRGGAVWPSVLHDVPTVRAKLRAMHAELLDRPA